MPDILIAVYHLCIVQAAPVRGIPPQLNPHFAWAVYKVLATVLSSAPASATIPDLAP